MRFIYHTTFVNPIVPLSFPLSYHLRSTQFSTNHCYSAHSRFSHFSHLSHLSHLSQNAHHSHFFPNHEVLENHEVLATEREPEGQAKRSKAVRCSGRIIFNDDVGEIRSGPEGQKSCKYGTNAVGSFALTGTAPRPEADKTLNSHSRARCARFLQWFLGGDEVGKSVGVVYGKFHGTFVGFWALKKIVTC